MRALLFFAVTFPAIGCGGRIGCFEDYTCEPDRDAAVARDARPEADALADTSEAVARDASIVDADARGSLDVTDADIDRSIEADAVDALDARDSPDASDAPEAGPCAPHVGAYSVSFTNLVGSCPIIPKRTAAGQVRTFDDSTETDPNYCPQPYSSPFADNCESVVDAVCNIDSFDGVTHWNNAISAKETVHWSQAPGSFGAGSGSYRNLTDGGSSCNLTYDVTYTRLDGGS